MLNIKSFIFNPVQENTYVIYNEYNNCAIVDPGCYFDDEKNELAMFIGEMKLRPVALLNTHCHLDHVFGCRFVAEKFDLQMQIHEQEKLLFDFAPVSGLTYNMPFDNYTGEFIFLQEHDVIRIGEDELKVMITSGHSPGSLSFYCEKDKFVISGDALFCRSIGRTDLPGGDHDLLLKNIREKLFVLPDDTKVYSGHGPATLIGDEKKLNPFFT